MEELKVCPFCGSESLRPNEKPVKNGYEIGCHQMHCPVKPYVLAATQDEAIERWNTRPTPPTAPDAAYLCSECGKSWKEHYEPSPTEAKEELSEEAVLDFLTRLRFDFLEKHGIQPLDGDIAKAICAKFSPRTKRLTEEINQEMFNALMKTHKYFMSCAHNWKGKTDAKGHPIAEGESLDQLADEAGEAVGKIVLKMEALAEEGK